MPSFCAVVGCSSRSNGPEKPSMFRFPAEKDSSGKVHNLRKQRRLLWIKRLRRADLTENILKNDRVCSKHFNSGKPANLYDENNPDWAPTLNLGYKKTDDNEKIKIDRYKRAKNRGLVTTSYAEGKEEGKNVELSLVAGEENEHDFETDNKQLKSSHEAALKENHRLLAMINCHLFKLESFSNNNAKTCFFTGLRTYSLLNTLFGFVRPHIDANRTNLDSFQQFCLTLMKLRHNYLFTDLGYRFNISRRTASKIFYKVLNILYYRLKWLVYWPTRDELISTMPQCFKEAFGNKVTTIIDCFEVFSEKPSNPKASASSFSHYKHHHTVKFLLGISPQGTIMFISDAYGGKASDKFITDTSGFLDKLSCGDLVLADRGFLINEMVENRLATVKTPAFLKGQKQMPPESIESTRKLACVRIHVERVISTLKQKYTIFSGRLQQDVIKIKYEDNIPALNKMVTISCALVNINSSIV